MEKKKINKKDIGFYIVYTILVSSTLALYIKEALQGEWTFNDVIESIPLIKQALLLNFLISISIIIFSFIICSLVKDNKVDSIRRIVTAFFCFLLILPGGMITQAIILLVESRGDYREFQYMNLESIPKWISVIIPTSLKLVGVSLLILGYIKQVKSKITLIDAFKCSLITGLINFAMLSRISYNIDMWHSIAFPHQKEINSFSDFTMESPRELMKVIIEVLFISLLIVFIYQLIKTYLNYDKVKTSINYKKYKTDLYNFIGGGIGVFVVTLPYWIVGQNTLHNFSKIDYMEDDIIFGIKSGLWSALIGVVLIIIILMVIECFSKKILAVGLLVISFLLSISTNSFAIGDILNYLGLLKSEVSVGIIVNLNFISFIGVLLYFTYQTNSYKKIGIRNYVKVGFAVFIMKFISGFMAYGQLFMSTNRYTYQPMEHFYYTFVESHGINPKYNSYTDPMTAGIMVAIMGILIVISMMAVSKILDNEEGSNTIWLGILHK